MFPKNTVIDQLPLIEFVKTLYPSVSLNNTCLVSVQHLLGTTHTMLRSLFELGLEPQNVFILGKCYSTNDWTAQNMIEEGIHVSPYSSVFHSKIPYDSLFDLFVSHLANLQFDLYERIIVLDDGGELICRMMSRFPHLSQKMVGVEQTTAGFEKLKKVTIPFPVLNVAKSRLKTNYEPSLISERVVDRTFAKLKRLGLHPDHILVIGEGSIGAALTRDLRESYQVSVYDKNKANHSLLEALLPKADLIFGCTGTTSLPRSTHHLLRKGCVLASTSSSDREFDSVYIRNSVESYLDCHLDVFNGHVHLLNSGFPINFDGDINCVAREEIQIIRALLALGILQGCELIGKARGLIELHREHEEELNRLELRRRNYPKAH
jgi:S-adenosylhomocysteine hydrolase